jgi:general secretion pathway protein A
MYEAFYGLKERPFNLTPDPKYLYLSDKHKEAFAHLLFGIKHRSGFVMVTGEIGTGKTTICRNLLNQIDPETNLAFVFNPPLNPVELIKKINVEFGINHAPDTSLELTEILNKFLLEQAAAARNCVLVIDEAQNLSPQVLEQIRLLSNLETETDKLLQIVLIGQPELGEKLALHELRQLNQRITARYHLKPLSEHETLQYIAYRLHVAGGRRKIQFSKGAVKQVYKVSGGTPRVINAVCDRALLIGYTKEAVNISAAIVKQAAKEIRGEKVVVERPVSFLLRKLLPSPAMALTAVVIIGAVWLIARPAGRLADQMGRFNDIVLPPQAPSTPSNAVEAKAEPTTTEADEAKRQEEIRAAVAKAVAEKIAPGALTATPQPAPSSQELNAVLESLTPEAALVSAGEALLAAWNITSSAPALAESSPDGLAAFITRHGLQAEALQPGYEQLLSIGLPAFVKVKHGQKDLWLALTGAKDGNVNLAIAGKQITAPAMAFKDIYLAEAIIPWRDPDPKAPAMSIGRSGSAVATFKDQLRQLGRLDLSNKSDAYDQEAARAVSRIQAETGLTIDSVAGRQVRMIMSAWAPAEGTPLLRGPAATPATAPVAKAESPKQAPAPEKAPAAESTPLPTPEQLNNAVPDGSAQPEAEKKPEEAPKDGLVDVSTLPKPENAPATENPQGNGE